MSVDKNSLRAKSGSGAQRHGGMDSELARGIRCGGDYAAIGLSSANNNRFALERRIIELFHGDEEGVHVDVKYAAGHEGILPEPPTLSNPAIPLRQLNLIAG